jgi:hypothetical protein
MLTAYMSIVHPIFTMSNVLTTPARVIVEIGGTQSSIWYWLDRTNTGTSEPGNSDRDKSQGYWIGIWDPFDVNS